MRSWLVSKRSASFVVATLVALAAPAALVAGCGGGSGDDLFSGVDQGDAAVDGDADASATDADASATDGDAGDADASATDADASATDADASDADATATDGDADAAETSADDADDADASNGDADDADAATTDGDAADATDAIDATDATDATTSDAPDATGDGNLCGNGVVDQGEACDPAIPSGQPGACPMSCGSAKACSTVSLVGAASDCSARCATTPVTACTGGDGCCPTGCNANTDSDCKPVCGNGVVEMGEACDSAVAAGQPGACPTSCTSTNACSVAQLTGSASQCNAVCTTSAVTTCSGTQKDGCCPASCNSTDDADCSVNCGNGIVETGETCDKAIPAGQAGACPTSCTAPNACTSDTLTGSATNCSAQCVTAAITACSSSKDGCCPAGCSANSDVDCNPVCGNSVVESGETCDPVSSCPTSCPAKDACTPGTLTGNAAACTSACAYSSITACTNGDGCCPSGCNANSDNDCKPVCGNGVVESGETCDPVSSCPTSCPAKNACTPGSLTGSASTCNSVCSYSSITACTNGDGCCPSGCTFANDNDCPSGVSASLSTVTAGSCLTAATGAQTAVVVKLVDATNNAVTGATVQIVSTAGSVGAVTANGSTYTAILTAPASAAVTSATVTVTANGVTLTTKPTVTIASPFTDLAGGAGGCTVQGNVRVRVVDATSQAPISGASVLVGGAANPTAYATTYGASASAPNYATTDANGYATFVDFGTTLAGAQYVTAGANNYGYASFADLNAADVIVPIEAITAPPVTGTTTGTFTGVNANTTVSFGLMIPDLKIDDLANFSFSKLLGNYQCYNAAGNNTAIPSNVYIPAQFFGLVGAHNYTSPGMTYGARKLMAVYGNAPLAALTGGGGITGALPQITLTSVGEANQTISSAGPVTVNIPAGTAVSKDVTCNASNLPAVSDVFCVTAVDFDSSSTAGANPGDGRIGFTGFKTTTLAAGATTASISGTARAPLTGNFANGQYIAAVAALYLDSGRAGIPAGTASGVTAILARKTPYGTAGGTVTANNPLPIRTLTQTARTAGLSAATNATSPTPSFVMHVFTQNVSSTYTACTANDETTTTKNVLWRVYASGTSTGVTLPTLPASFPRASNAGAYSGLVTPSGTTTLEWQAMTIYEGLRATPVVFDGIKLSEWRTNLTHVSSNNTTWTGP